MKYQSLLFTAVLFLFYSAATAQGNVVGMLFVYAVWTSLTMPDFSPTMLTLQGIVAGTYLGFKFPEKQV